jgi:hypothetical protein
LYDEQHFVPAGQHPADDEAPGPPAPQHVSAALHVAAAMYHSQH